MEKSERLHKYELLIDESMQCVREQGIVGRVTMIAYPEFIEKALIEAIPRTKAKVPKEDMEPLVKEICRRVQSTIPLPEGPTFGQRVMMLTYKEPVYKIIDEISRELRNDGVDRQTLRNKMAEEVKNDIRKRLKALDSIPESDIEELTEGIFIDTVIAIYPLKPAA